MVFYLYLLNFCYATIKMPVLITNSALFCMHSTFLPCRVIGDVGVAEPTGHPFLLSPLEAVTFWFMAIHILYLELDISQRKNKWLVRILHPISFSGTVWW